MHTSALKTPAVMWEHYLVAFCPVSGNSEVSKCRNVFCAEEAFPARTWTPFKMLTFLENTDIVHYPVTRPQFYNDCVELTAKETDGTETLEKPPRAGGAHTRCSGDSPSTSFIIFLSELGQYFLFCSLTIFRSLVHTIQFLLQEIYTTLNSLHVWKAATHRCWDHQACQHSHDNILLGLKIASPKNSLSIIPWSFLCLQRYT